jgi:hypothetical protein
VPEAARPALDLLADQLRDLRERIETVTKRIEAAQKADPLARRLATIPGLGPIASSAFAVTTPDVAAFRSARDYSAWLGLTPKPHSSGGKERLGRISKAGNTYLRRLLYLGAMAQIAARRRGRPGDDWLWGMLQRKPVKVVAIALANRMARVVWALIRTGRKLPGHPGLTTYAGHGRLRDGEAQREVMATGRRNGNRNTLFGPEHLRVRAIDRDPSAGELHQGAQPSRCTSDAAHMAATDQTHLPNNALTRSLRHYHPFEPVQAVRPRRISPVFKGVCRAGANR